MTMNEATRKFIKEHLNDDIHTLALQAGRYPDVDMREAVTQIEGYRNAKSKLPEWAQKDGIIFPPRISMEQCSSQATALYKASLLQGESVADLTGGFGIDCSYIARNFSKAFYIERSPLLCNIARNNFAVLGLRHITITEGECETVLPSLPHLDWIFIDPARRDGDGRKVVALADCTPSVTALEEALLQKSGKVMIKCSPMLDAAAARRELKNISEVHIIAVNNECKELLFILDREKKESVTTHCINITGESREAFSFTDKEETAALATHANELGQYLYEPNAAIQKAGCHRALTTATSTCKLHPNSQLYTADRFIAQFPGRKFRIIKQYGFAKNDIKELTTLKKGNITVRNFPDSVEQLRKRLKLADGGDNYIFATTLADGRKVLILCEKI